MRTQRSRCLFFDHNLEMNSSSTITSVTMVGRGNLMLSSNSPKMAGLQNFGILNNKNRWPSKASHRMSSTNNHGRGWLKMTGLLSFGVKSSRNHCPSTRANKVKLTNSR